MPRDRLPARRHLFAEVIAAIEQELGPAVSAGVADILRRGFAGERIYVSGRAPERVVIVRYRPPSARW